MEIIAAQVPCDTSFDPSNVIVVSWEPRIFVYPNFLSDEECEHFKQKGINAGLQRSQVAGAGQAEASEARTSYGTFIEDDGDPIMRSVEDRMARWAQIPLEHGEV